MAHATVNDLDYLVARLHGRRGRLAEGERLDPLCRCRTVPDLACALFPGEAVQTAAQFQRRVVEDLAAEIADIAGYLREPQARLLRWMLVRFALENLKVRVRGILTGLPPAVARQHLVALPDGLDVDLAAAASSLEEVIDRLPDVPLGQALREAAIRHRGESRPFFFETALDRAYLRELLARADRLPAGDRDAIAPLVRQEVDIFHLMLVVRGRFVNALPAEQLLPLHVAGTDIPQKRFAAMLGDPDVAAAAGRAAGRALDPVPASVAQDPALVESLAWHRWLRLANAAFRASHMGFGAVVGYVAIRRMEVANLVTLSEGLRAGLPPEAIRQRLVPRGQWKEDDA